MARMWILLTRKLTKGKCWQLSIFPCVPASVGQGNTGQIVVTEVNKTETMKKRSKDILNCFRFLLIPILLLLPLYCSFVAFLTRISERRAILMVPHPLHVMHASFLLCCSIVIFSTFQIFSVFNIIANHRQLQQNLTRKRHFWEFFILLMFFQVTVSFFFSHLFSGLNMIRWR